MKIQCAWCGKPMGEKPPYEDKSVTHSICPECEAKYFPEKEEGSMAKHEVEAEFSPQELEAIEAEAEKLVGMFHYSQLPNVIQAVAHEIERQEKKVAKVEAEDIKVIAEELHNYYTEKPWVKHPPGIAHKSENKLNCSMVADWLMKFYYALPNASESAYTDAFAPGIKFSEPPFDAKQFAEHIKLVVLEATAEETVDTKPYMSATEKEANKLLEMAEHKATPADIYKQVEKLRDTYLENVVGVICACEKGELPISDRDQMKKHERVIESWGPGLPEEQVIKKLLIGPQKDISQN